jgi:hypothetical protein
MYEAVADGTLTSYYVNDRTRSFHRDVARVTVANAESDLGKGALPHPLFGLDRDAAGVLLNDADELNGLFDAALGAEVITGSSHQPTSPFTRCRSRIPAAARR